jgi:hypothetical protein
MSRRQAFAQGSHFASFSVIPASIPDGSGFSDR